MQEYIKKHRIVESQNNMTDFVCCEIIVDDPIEFVYEVLQHNCYISYILWWDRVKVGDTSNIGHGGRSDPRDPEKYWFSETYLSKKFESDTTAEEYCEYIKSIMNDHPGHDLYPGMDVVQK